MNKQHWNTIELVGRLSANILMELSDQSYQLIIESLPKKLQLELKTN